MNVKLSIKERLILPAILPQEGDYATLIVRKDLIAKISLSQDELVEYKVEALEGGSLKWNNVDVTFDFEIKELEEKLIKKSLKELSEKEKLSADFVPLYEMFVVQAE